VTAVAAVVFDLDGVLLDSEQAWDDARRDLAAETGRPWPDSATRDMMGMSSREWPVYVRDAIGVPLSADEINADIVRRVLERYHRELPLLPGAAEAVERIADRWPIALASSSNREVIDHALAEMGVADRFAATVSSEEVGRGKPAPDVYLEAARRLDVDPAAAVAVEDSENGIRSAHAAGMRVLAVPNPHFPPAAEAVGLATVLADLGALTPDAVEGRQ
jgi:HAD superfamily hydrolase (TIGR01509 family)